MYPTQADGSVYFYLAGCTGVPDGIEPVTGLIKTAILVPGMKSRVWTTALSTV